MELIVSTLRMVDGDKKPKIGFLYEAIRLMTMTVKEAVGRFAETYAKIINDRWTNMLLHPLHEAAYYLNAKYHYKNGLGQQGNLIQAVYNVVEQLESDLNIQTDILNEVKYFRGAFLSFGRPTIVIFVISKLQVNGGCCIGLMVLIYPKLQ